MRVQVKWYVCGCGRNFCLPEDLTEVFGDCNYCRAKKRRTFAKGAAAIRNMRNHGKKVGGKNTKEHYGMKPDGGDQ